MQVVGVSEPCSAWLPPSAHTEIVLPRYGVFYVMGEGLVDAVAGTDVRKLGCGLPGCEGCPGWIAFDPQRDRDLLVAHSESDHLHLLNMDEGHLLTHQALTRIDRDAGDHLRTLWLEWHDPVLLVFTELQCVALDRSFAAQWDVHLDGALTMGLRYDGVRDGAVQFVDAAFGAFAYALSDGRRIDVPDAASYADASFVVDGVRITIFARRLAVGERVDGRGPRWKVKLPPTARYEHTAEGKLVFRTDGDSRLFIDVQSGAV